MGIWDKFTNHPWNKPFSHAGDPYKDAQGPVNKGWNEAQNYQRPFWQNGVNQTGRLNDAENSLLNPTELQNKWASSYEQSPYAKQMLAQNQTSGLEGASSMGLMGSSAALGNIQQGAHKIVNEDRQQYMNDLMMKYMTGIGLGQNMYNTGASAGANLGQGAMEHGRDIAGLKFNEEQAPNEIWQRLIGLLGGGAAHGATGGVL